LRGTRSQLPKPALGFLVLALLLFASCTKSKVGYWGQPAGPEEQLTPGFPETAARLYSALEQERQKLALSDAEFDAFQPTVLQLKDETRKAVRSRVDRDLDFLLEGYAGKLGMLRNYRALGNGAEYLPALRQQLEECHADLDKLFTTHPMPRPSVFGHRPLGPCMMPVPRTK
jgi:hypothetical protein